ncbi:hypothetical protein [Nannocystis punicea]|uniref:Alpha/beta hydrolase family protein n=1 Tax=Nannocystis punicea TaxID=2995304 RepID=A0ABY7GXC1_9BACT|nr:hypothetical protein [Nannocystis poenicansa]WAS91464.1 hypothetical protein O0S08_35220 [Nannocystis poenicansa]
MDKALQRAGFAETYFHTGEVGGPARGTSLVFIHGQSVTWEEYTFIMPFLAERRIGEDEPDDRVWARTRGSARRLRGVAAARPKVPSATWTRRTSKCG